jgi:Tol biopolymer transport system component
MVPYLSGMSANQLAFTRDGQWVAYVSYTEGTLWRSRVDGSQRVQLSFPPVRVWLPRWSPDGKRIAFFAAEPGKPHKIYLISSEGGSPVQAMPGEHNEADPDWSPDGSLLVFGGAPWAEGGRPGSTAIRLLELTTQQVSTLPGSEGLYVPRWSPDGHYIAAVPAEGPGLMLFDFRTRKWEQADKDHTFNSLSWSRDGSYIYFDDQSPDDPAIWRLAIPGRKLERVASLKGVRQPHGFMEPSTGLAPDGSPLLTRDIGTQEIYALDWEAP